MLRSTPTATIISNARRIDHTFCVTLLLLGLLTGAPHVLSVSESDDGASSSTTPVAAIRTAREPGPAQQKCTGAASKVFVAPSWSPYNTPGASGHGIVPVPPATCEVCDENKNIAPLALASVEDDVSFNLTDAVLQARVPSHAHTTSRPPIPPFPHPPTHLLTRPACSPAYVFVHSLTRTPCTVPPTHSCPHLHTHSLIAHPPHCRPQQSDAGNQRTN
jgi:hypothetical protein